MRDRQSQQGTRYEPPGIHRLMVYVATLVLVMALVAYLYHPGDDVLVTVIATVLGFLFGKASNGIDKGSGWNGTQN